MSAVRRLRSFAWACGAVVALASAVSACGGSNSSSTSTAPTVTATPQPELFEGSLNVGGSAFFSFNVQATGDADVMLASVTTSPAPGTSTNVVLGMAIGSPLGTDCIISTSVLASAALQSPLVSNLTAGTYCVRVYDVGNMTAPVNFAIRIVHT
jgi:hypothetical protein